MYSVRRSLGFFGSLASFRARSRRVCFAVLPLASVLSLVRLVVLLSWESGVS